MTANVPASPDLIRQVICAPLNLGKLHWTSLDIANHVGVSQSRVARTWRATYSQNPSFPELPNQIRITDVYIVATHTYLFCEFVETAIESTFHSNGAEMRSPRRFSMQSLLAAQVLAAENQDESDRKISFEDLVGGTTRRLVLTTDESFHFKDSRIVHVAKQNWQSLLPYLVACAHKTSAASLRELHQELILWSLSPEKDFTWHFSPVFSPVSQISNSSLTVKSTQQVVAEQVFEAIINRIWNGLLTAGDRINEASLARELHTTRNQTRDAIRSLISIGLLDHDPIRGALVPTPSTKDVIDIYAARKALGVEIIKRVIRNVTLDFDALLNSFHDLERIANTGDSYETGNADLRFQDVIAANSGMRNIPQMFSTLAKQLRIYIAIMGITYVYSIEDMVKDDRAILSQIKERNVDLAISAWKKKVDDSLTFMTNHVSKFR